MNPDLDPFLEAIKRERIPPGRSSFEAGVWERISRRRRLNAAVPWWLGWQTPGIAAVGAAAALAVGILTGWWSAPAFPHDREALGLQAFSAEAPNLPSTLLRRTP